MRQPHTPTSPPADASATAAMKDTTPAVAPPFAKGDYVYYRTPAGETVPAVVLKAGPKRVLVDGNFCAGDRRAWVLPANVELQSKAE